MQGLRFIPNALTLGNLLMGVLAIVNLNSDPTKSILFVALGALFDFFDGFAARKLGLSNEMGKQLDSLADMVTFGVAPACIAFYITPVSYAPFEGTILQYSPYLCFTIALASAYRLAKFNLSTTQIENFKGLPTPANALFWVGFLAVLVMSNKIELFEILENKPFIVPILSLIFSFLLISNIPMFGLKFKSFGIQENLWKYILLILAVLMLVFLKWMALPFIVILYIILSIIKNSIHDV